MKRSQLLAIFWGILYLVNAGLGFVTEAGTVGQAVMILLAALFFLPPFLLLREGVRWKKRILILSSLSLVLTTAALAASYLTAAGSAALGSAMHVCLVLVSVPMTAGKYWIASLFLWACLLNAAMLKKTGRKA